MHIRPATIDDVEALFDIRCSVRENYMSREEMVELDITPATVRAMIASGDYCVPLACHGTTPVGFAMAEIAAGYVFALFVRPTHESKGIGSTLLHLVEEDLRCHGILDAYLVTEANPQQRAFGFYRHHNWLDAGLLKDGQMRFCKHLATVL